MFETVQVQYAILEYLVQEICQFQFIRDENLYMRLQFEKTNIVEKIFYIEVTGEEIVFLKTYSNKTLEYLVLEI